MKKRLLTLAIAFSLFIGLVAPVPALAVDVLSPGCQEAPGSAACTDNQNESSSGNRLYGPTGLLTKAAQLIAQIAGIAGVIMIIIAGFKYVTSSGDPQNVKSAKDTVIFAIVGLIVAVIAQSIVVFVLRAL